MEQNGTIPVDLLAQGRNIILTEAKVLLSLAETIGQEFTDAVALLLACRGRVVVTGVGKSGHIGKKIAASLASTGTPTFFIHSTEALHGDLGMLTSEDLVLAISHSGETAEVLGMLPCLESLGLPIIGITGKSGSTLGRASRVNLVTGVTEEADPLGLAPTSSALATLALGDALALTVSGRKQFSREDFARCHPGGALGRALADTPSGGRG